MGGTPIEEFVGLRSKMYSIMTSDGIQKNTAKGVSRIVSENVLTHSDYFKCLFEKTNMKHEMTRIVNENHQIFTVTFLYLYLPSSLPLPLPLPLPSFTFTFTL